MPRFDHRLAPCALLLTLTFAAAPPALAEDCWHGPSGITSQLGQMVTVTTPPGGSVTVNFDFNALWENELFVCDGASHQLLGVRGNTRDRSTWTSPAAPAGQTHDYVFAAFHKTVSASAGDAGEHPWIQSPKRDLTPMGQRLPPVEQYGFSDEGTRDRRDDNVLLTVTYNGNRHPAPSVTLTVTPASIAIGGTATLSWEAKDASTCSGSGAQTFDAKGITQGSETVKPQQRGAKTYRIVCRGDAPPVASASATLQVVQMGRGRPIVKIPDGNGNLGGNEIYTHH